MGYWSRLVLLDWKPPQTIWVKVWQPVEKHILSMFGGVLRKTAPRILFF